MVVVSPNAPKSYRNEIEAETSRVKRVIEQIKDLINVEDYEKELGNIKFDTDSAFSFDNFGNLDLQKQVLKKLRDLGEKIEKETMPFYQMNKIQYDINLKLKDKEKGIDEAIKLSKDLIDKINSVEYIFVKDVSNKIIINDTFDREDLKKIYDSAVETLYKVMIDEQIYDRHTLIDEVTNKENNIVVKDKLFECLIEDLKSTKKINDVIDMDNVNEGLSYDLISIKVIDSIIESKYHKEKEAYYERMEEAREDLKKRIFDYQTEVNTLNRNTKELKASIRNIRADRRINRAKLLSYVLVPVMAITSGYFAGVAFSNQIDEYRTVTRTVDPETKKVVETLSDIYDERENTYTSTIKIYEPWKKNSKGTYTRNVTAYVNDDNTDFNDVSKLTEKYHYTEAKETLDSKDSTEESTVLITETIQDKNDHRKSRKYVIPLAIAGGVIATIIDVLMGINMGTYGIQCELRKLRERLQEKKMVKGNLDNSRKELKRDGGYLEKTCETASSIYQFSDDEFSTLKVIKKTL